MRIKYFRTTIVSACLGLLATWLAVGQPVVTTQPTNQFFGPGPTANFSVLASGAGPITYQWMFDGTALANATNRLLSLPNPQPAQWGFYSVLVSNSSGAVTSQVAELKVFVSAPHSLAGIQAQSNGSVSLTFAGETSALFAPYYDLYPLEASSNLVDWTSLGTLQRTNTAVDTLAFVDTNASNFSQRFYRTPTNQLETPDPQPTGPYPVGTFSMPLTNVNRENAKFMVTFWYPAVAQAGDLPAKYVEPFVALSGDNFYDLRSAGGGNFDGQVAAFYSHSISNAPALAANVATFPVLLYDPGAGGHRRENTDKAEELASWGYVVVGLDTSDTDVSVFPNGAVVYGQSSGSASGAALIQELNADIEGRLLDMEFVLDELESLNVDDPRLGGRLDLDKIGSFGWSLGGATTAQLCLRDPRCKAGVCFDGLFFETNVLTQPLSVPLLYFDEDDLMPDPAIYAAYARPDDRLAVYNEQVTNAYWVKLVSTVHGNFSDPGIIDDSASLEVFWGTPLSGQFLPGARVTQIVRACLLSFFNKFLEGQDDHLLDGPPPAYPEIKQFLSTSTVSSQPQYPSAGLVEGSDGSFYGTTAYGGTSSKGALFRATTNGALTTLVSFNGANGSHPVAALARGSDGNFYGTTEYGGSNGNYGTVFQLTPAGTLTTLVSFKGTNGSQPAAGLAQDTDGNFYGTTQSGGNLSLNNGVGFGTVFELTAAGVLRTLVAFNSANGAGPTAGLARGSDGNFYGTTQGGGSDANGTVFKMTPGGALTTMISFDGADGEVPTAVLVQGANGDFYCTAPYGGNLTFNAGSGFGTVFRMTSTGLGASLLSFNGANGSYCIAGLVQGTDGNFYGTTQGGGAGGCGTVFKMTAAGNLTTLVSFNGANGCGPAAALVQGADGNFYGTTEFGGAGGFGTVFQMTPAGALTTLVAFGGQTNFP